jgi:hypothetical protein
MALSLCQRRGRVGVSMATIASRQRRRKEHLNCSHWLQKNGPGWGRSQLFWVGDRALYKTHGAVGVSVQQPMAHAVGFWGPPLWEGGSY